MQIDISRLSDEERASFREAVAELGDRPPSTDADARRSANLHTQYELERGHPLAFHTPFSGMRDDWSKWLAERREKEEAVAAEAEAAAQAKREKEKPPEQDDRPLSKWRQPPDIRSRPEAGARGGGSRHSRY